jgi:TolB-like protein
LFSELRRRSVVRVGAAYAIGCWLVLQVADLVLENLEAPGWIMKAVMLAMAIGLPLVLAFAWVFELTPEGVKRDAEVDRSVPPPAHRGQRLNRAIIAMLVLALGILVAERLTLGSRQPADEPELAAVSPGVVARPRTVAVLPFVNRSADPEQSYFADGLTEEIINALSQLPELKVTARTSAFHFRDRDLPLDEIAATLGVDHIVEGSVRSAGERVRITAQLSRAADGFNLWSDTYERRLEDTFAVQTDIATQIALSLEVVMDDRRRRLMATAGVRDAEAFIAYQKGRERYDMAHGADQMIPLLREANDHFDRALARVPEMALAYRLHSDLYTHLLLNAATGIPDAGFAREDVASAVRQMEADFRAAADHAPNRTARDNAELSLRIVTGDWRGLATKVDRIIGNPGCNNPQWAHLVSSPFGRAQRMVDFWIDSALWDGEVERALAIGAEVPSLVDHAWIWRIRAISLAADGRFDEGRTLAQSRIREAGERWRALIEIDALEGNSGSLVAFLDEFERGAALDEAFRVTANAWLGERDTANEFAGRIDARELGYMGLLMSIYFCHCGAPFDLSATPDFAARLEASGLPWPPPQPLEYPLKDW